MNNILDTLNPPQRQAVEHREGALLVLAGAGSGKTRVITHRFARLLEQEKLTVNRILAVTFTNKAAGEMKERIHQLTHADTRFAWIRTFHSMGMQLLRNHSESIGYPRQFGIYDDTDSKGLVKTVMKDLNISHERYNPGSVYHVISRAKDDLVGVDDFTEQADSEFDEIAGKVYREYQQRLLKNRAVDFSDLIGLPIRLLDQNPAIRQSYQELWRYVMVDEFQDTNKAQYRLLQLLLNNENNICVVGDDDQSIYGWRGAHIDNIYDFKDRYQARVIPLEQNYRSTSVILEAANHVVQLIPGRMEKKLWTERASSDKITLLEAGRDRDEAQYIAEAIRNRDSETSLRDIAVFYRTNAQSRLLEEALLHKNIPYRIFGGQKFYERKEIKDVLAYINLILNPWDQSAFERIINVPRRKAGPAAVDKLLQYSSLYQKNLLEILQSAGQIEGIGPALSRSLTDLSGILSELNQASESMSPMNFVKVLLDAIGYQTYIKEYDEDGLDRWANVEELINSIRVYEENNPEGRIGDFLGEVSLQTATDNLDGEGERDYVSLMTIHNAKGLEFSTVYLSGVNDGLIPHSTSLSSSRELDEERRLFYVAITRARNQLCLSYSLSRLQYGDIMTSRPSPFLQDIPENLLERKFTSLPQKTAVSYSSSQVRRGSERQYTARQTPRQPDTVITPAARPQTREIESLDSLSIGDMVWHHSFGQGRVAFISPRMIKVEFAEYGIKVLGGNMSGSLARVVDNA